MAFGGGLESLNFTQTLLCPVIHEWVFTRERRNLVLLIQNHYYGALRATPQLAPAPQGRGLTLTPVSPVSLAYPQMFKATYQFNKTASTKWSLHLFDIDAIRVKPIFIQIRHALT